MQNLLILGSGRSGTSMVAGTLRNAGYFMGHDLLEPVGDASASNPRGFFEDFEINNINEQILAQVTPRRPPLIGRWLFRNRPGYMQRWLARIPIRTKLSCTPELGQRIASLTKRQPFCFKDPRFSYTLPCWLPYLDDTRYIVVFRDPTATAVSIETECRVRHYLRDLAITRGEILETWALMYSHVLHFTESLPGPWLFLHYDQVLQGDGLDRLEAFSGALVDRSFPERALRRSAPTAERASRELSRLYRRLCTLAEYHDPQLETAQ
jgi:Sulfotransferase family